MSFVSATCAVQFKLRQYASQVLLDGPEAYWRLGEATGTTAADETGNLHTGTYAGGVSLAEVGALADGDSAVEFDGTAGAKVTTLTPPGVMTALTVELFAKPHAWNVADQVPINLAADDASFIAFPATKKTIVFTLVVGGVAKTATFTVAGGADVTLDEWYHIVGVWDGATVEIYVNGVAGTGAAAVGAVTVDEVLLGNNGAGAGQGWTGWLDEVAIFTKALTPAQVAAHYALRLAPEWTDVLAGGDVRAQAPIVCEYGIKGNDPTDRIASTGTLSFSLDNSPNNSGGVLGYHSPLHASKRLGFDFNVPARWQLSSGGNSSYKFRGALADIVPVPGVHEGWLVPCLALDWMDDAARMNLPDLDAQLGQRSDQLITTILAALPAADRPVAQSIETGLETFSIALDGGVGRTRPKVREVINSICLSELGYFYLRGNATTGGVAQFENRHHRSANPATLLALTDGEVERGGLAVPGSRDDIYRSVQVFVRPTRVDAAATTVLFELQTVSALLAVGESLTIWGPYRDPDTNDQIGGLDTVDPVATTDFLLNAAADGSGADLTDDLTVVAARTGLGVSFVCTNTGVNYDTPGYVTKLQVRGKGIYRYDAMIEVSVPGSTYGDRVLTVEMPMQNSLNVGTDVANFLATLLSTPYAKVPSVRFLANRSAALMEAAILREPGDRISLSETVTGVDTVFTINSVRLEYVAPGVVWCTWGLEPAISQYYWLIGIAGASEIGLTTVVGF